MRKLSPMDRAFFLLETEQRPMNIGLLVVVAPRRAGQRGFADEVVRRMLKCPVGAPFNCRVAAEGVLGLPQLVEVPQVDPAAHLFRHRLPQASDEQTLFERICAIHVRRLDRGKPLWQMHVFEGLPNGRVALYFKTHHGLIDGIGFLKVVLNSVSSKPTARVPQALWRGLPQAQADRTDAGHAQESALQVVARSAWQLGRLAGDMARLLLHEGLRDLGLGRGLATPFVTTPNVLKAPPSNNRVLGHCALPLERVKAIAHASNAKVNDVLLAALDVALNRYLELRGTTAERPLVADMPVALHDDGGAGNRITILQVPMGRPHGTAAERLGDIVRETRQLKQEVRTLSADTLFLYSILEHAAASAIETLNLGELPMLANTVISNPAGLDAMVYLNGAAVELALPVSVVAHHQVLNITLTNYAGHIHATFIAQREALPDVQRVADFTVDALGELNRVFVRRKKAARAAVALAPGRASTKRAPRAVALH